MKKIEIIWRELLYQVLEKRNNRFVQKDLAEKFSFSTSTIFQALKVPRRMGAVRVGGREFILQDPEKLLYHWASVRDIVKDIVYKTRVDLPVLEIESRVIPQSVFACYSAYRLRYNEASADYDSVWVYAQKSNIKKQKLYNLQEIKKRFPEKKGRPNFMVLGGDWFIGNYGQTTTISQTFVDLWNLSDWFAKEFINSLKEKINEVIS